MEKGRNWSLVLLEIFKEVSAIWKSVPENMKRVWKMEKLKLIQFIHDHRQHNDKSFSHV